MSEPEVKELMQWVLAVALWCSLMGGIATVAVITILFKARRIDRAYFSSQKLLSQALEGRYGMDDAFIERMKQEFFGGEKQRDEKKKPS